MDEKEFNDLIGDVTDELSVRLHYGNHIGYLREWLMKMGEPVLWLQQAIEGWDEYEDLSLDSIKESFDNLREFMGLGLHALYEMIQDSAQYLYGEKFPIDSFHVSGCECDDHNNNKEEK